VLAVARDLLLESVVERVAFVTAARTER